MTSVSFSSSEVNCCISKRKIILGAGEGKQGNGALGECFEEQGKEVVL
jgi:hypothetical protein